MFSEELEKILSQVLMKHHDDISSQDEDAIAEARDAITELVNKNKGCEHKTLHFEGKHLAYLVCSCGNK
jgi:hypothetical protein